jgi:hypothetical protein
LDENEIKRLENEAFLMNNNSQSGSKNEELSSSYS